MGMGEKVPGPKERPGRGEVPGEKKTLLIGQRKPENGRNCHQANLYMSGWVGRCYAGDA